MRDVRLHDLRHSYASQAARIGVPRATIKEMLGHTKIENTARYTHFNDHHLIDIANRISDLIDAALAGQRPVPSTGQSLMR